MPTVPDLANLVLARASTRVALRRANDDFSDAMLLAFRNELASTVRSVSPLLLSLLENLGLDLDDLAWSIQPVPGWPDHPRLPVSGPHLPTTRIGLARREAAWRARARAFAPEICHSVFVTGPAGDRLNIHVVDHAIELAAWLGPIRLRSLFGAFRVAMPREALPGHAAPRVGDKLDALVTHPSLRGRGWSVAAVDAFAADGECRFSVRTGSFAYSMPWSPR